MTHRSTDPRQPPPGVLYLGTVPRDQDPTMTSTLSPYLALAGPDDAIVTVWRRYLADTPTDVYACPPGTYSALRRWAFWLWRGLGATIRHPHLTPTRRST